MAVNCQRVGGWAQHDCRMIAGMSRDAPESNKKGYQMKYIADASRQQHF